MDKEKAFQFRTRVRKMNGRNGNGMDAVVRALLNHGLMMSDVIDYQIFNGTISLFTKKSVIVTSVN